MHGRRFLVSMCVGTLALTARASGQSATASSGAIAAAAATRAAGPFYAFANVTGTRMSSKDLADVLLNEAGVASLNGTALGAHGDRFLRFSYANSLANIEEAMARVLSLSERWAACAAV